MNDRIVTCVYCGHEYPEGTPTSQDEKLTEHIKVCDKHPMRNLKQQLAAANARMEELEQKKPSYEKEFECIYEKLKAEEQLSEHYKHRAKQAEAQCDAMQNAINRYVLGNIGLLDALKAALEEKP